MNIGACEAIVNRLVQNATRLSLNSTSIALVPEKDKNLASGPIVIEISQAMDCNSFSRASEHPPAFGIFAFLLVSVLKTNDTVQSANTSAGPKQGGLGKILPSILVVLGKLSPFG
jgi:hypothetical protein